MTLKEYFFGKQAKFNINKNVVCQLCNGKGTKNDYCKAEKCGKCKGSGSIIHVEQHAFLIRQIQQPCDQCNGSGEFVKIEDRCQTCSGKKIVKEKKLYNLNILPGMRPGDAKIIEGEGNQVPDIKPGNIVFIFGEKRSEERRSKNTYTKNKHIGLFEEEIIRQGADLLLKISISLEEAISGFQCIYTDFDEKDLVLVKTPGKIVKPGTQIRFKNLGMPIPSPDSSLKRGDLILECDVNFPEYLDDFLREKEMKNKTRAEQDEECLNLQKIQQLKI